MVHDRKCQLTSTKSADDRDSKSESPSITDETSSKHNIISDTEDPTGSEHQHHHKQQIDNKIPSKKETEISMQDFVKAITDDKVVALMSIILLNNAHVM